MLKELFNKFFRKEPEVKTDLDEYPLLRKSAYEMSSFIKSQRRYFEKNGIVKEAKDMYILEYIYSSLGDIIVEESNFSKYLPRRKRQEKMCRALEMALRTIWKKPGKYGNRPNVVIRFVARWKDIDDTLNEIIKDLDKKS
jgi:hypothetical protein